ncbi:MAG: sugar phosphate isomerase/epimerase [Gemmatimonadetes bacterium]|jgi:sugar phosphate isomerase/epimerase|nr:sugar phosphate isomerase/epimerase [Gemmatimonadota bacterium]MBT6149092.1 sugar phosphate isomerase/epimerase [Gemmatimonadota bacterium]MBT7863675.1 sugar phosphate isomerase/epimerase [Gemmatimonadota bacterium]
MAFKLGFCALHWRQPDLEQALPALAESGWDGWECRLPIEWMGPVSRMRRLCDEAGMPVAVMSAQGSPDTRDWEHVELNKRRMEYAAELGADCFLFMNTNKAEDSRSVEDDIRAAAEGADEWAEYAAGMGLELTYHIHTNLLVDSIDEWRLYMSCLKTAKLCIDVSHAELWDYDPAQSLIDFYDQLNYVHLQDYSSCTVREPGRYNPEWVNVGEGECLDFKGCLDTLADKGYSRWVTACPETPPEGGTEATVSARNSSTMREYVRSLGY